MIKITNKKDYTLGRIGHGSVITNNINITQ